MTSLVERITQVAAALEASGLPWAIGGALALAYATEEPRGTRDIDVNVFVPSSRARDVFAALPAGVRFTDADIAEASRVDQVRLWWDDTPIDIFFSADQFHAAVARRRQTVPFEGRTISILSAEDLAVFKAMFDRTKDWADIEAMAEHGALDCRLAATRLQQVLGDDPRVTKLRSLAPAPS
jgi:hypothetical protein